MKTKTIRLVELKMEEFEAMVSDPRCTIFNVGKTPAEIRDYKIGVIKTLSPWIKTSLLKVVKMAVLEVS